MDSTDKSEQPPTPIPEPSPSLVPQSPSSAPSPAVHDESGDDFDLSITRKRPRLDSGSRAVRSLSAGPVLSPSAKDSAGASAPSESELKELTQSPKTPPVSQTPNRITLHVRTPGSAMPPSSLPELDLQPDDDQQATERDS